VPEPDNAGIKVFPPFIFLGGLILGYAVWWFWPVGLAPARWSVLIRLIGILLLVVGLALTFDAAAWFRRMGTTPDPRGASRLVVEEGPYRFTRNPMYVGMSLAMAGVALLRNAFWPLLALIPVLFIIQLMVVAREERYLDAKFGKQYREYRARVRRWL
jgi:protein-S-isoprenylcysteine O-methyltransferase Ste14